MGVVNRIKTSNGRTGRIAALCAAAGRVAGVGRGSRRGSVLVLILGGLAMLSIVAVVYVTVGQNDRRTGATTRSRDSVQDTAQGVADSIARIIGDDATATMVDGIDPQSQHPGNVVLVREAHDYPSTDYTLRTHGPALMALSPSERFNPVGSYDAVWGGAGADLRTPTDPWLASSEPTWLLGPGALSGNTNPATNFLYRIDWAQLSNIAPSGNPTNLYNLRGSFDAEAGFSVNPFNPPAGGARMSDRLTLFDANNFPNNVGGQTGRVVTLGFDTARNADPFTPAHWTTFQVGAFRPARDVDFGPEDYRYLPYQYADADGDGMFDSRWFELVDVSDPANPVSVLPRDDRFRWFVAPRIIDLSGRINVNTAADFRNAPTSAAVAGMSPADIDLLRVLRMDDPERQYSLSYQFVAAQLQMTAPLDWVLSQYQSSYSANRTSVGHYGYDGLRIALRDFGVPPFGAPITTAPLSFTPFTAAARAEFYRRAGSQGEGGSLGSFVSGTPPTTPVFTSGGVFGLADLLELLTHGGLNEPGEPSRLEAAVGGRFAQPISGANPQTAALSPLRDNWAMPFERGRIDDDENAFRGNGLADDEALAMRVLDPRPLLTTISHARPIVSQTVDPASTASLNADRELKVDVVAALDEASPPPATPPVAADANRLFAAYADALLPHSWREDAWDYSITPNPKFTLAYGADPMLSIWAAAHMTANAIDMYDRDGVTTAADKHEPSAFTLALGGTQTDLQFIDQYATASPPLFPYWTARIPTAPGLPLPARPGVLDLDWATGVTTSNQIPAGAPPSRLARQGDLAGLPVAMNVFGVEAQPFIVEVASLTIYTDAPASAYPPGSPRPDEWTPDDPVTGPSNNPITIRGDVTSTNPDIICQVLAFQITNPFDVDIGLGHGDRNQFPQGASGLPNDFGAYYIEFGGRFFRLAETDATGTSLRQVILEGRDSSTTNPVRDNTRTFYILNDTLTNIQTRLANAAPTVLLNGGAALVGDEVRRIIEHQLGEALPSGGPPGQRPIAPILIPSVDPASGVTNGTTAGLFDLFENTAVGADFKEVRLWRAVGATGAGNQRENDLLADRIRDPSAGSPTLDRRLPDADTAVLGTTAGRDPTAGGPLSGALDNTGFSILLWASYKRPDDPRGNSAAGQTTIPLGAIPAYCLERRQQPTGVAPWLHANLFTNHPNPATPAPGTQLDKCYFTGTPCPNQLANTLGEVRLAGASSLVSRLVDPVPASVLMAPSGTGSSTRSYITSWPEDKSADTLGDNFTATPYYQLYPEIHLNDDRFVGGAGANATVTLRVADMLLPLMVGPTCVPIVGQPAEWVTLAESLAVALNYSDPPAGDPVFGFLHGLGGGPPAGPRPRPKSDRGQLVLNDFAPFENNNNPGQPTFQVNTTDEPRWPGIPLGLRVLDVFTAAPRELGSIERGTPGLVNLNTAAPRAMSAVPMLRPNAGTAVGTPSMYWGPATHGAPSLPNLATTDVASSLEAYRDKREVETVVAGGASTRFDDLSRLTLDDPATWNGRFETNRVPALREAPGFASIGEVLCATENPTQLTNRTPAHSRADYLGNDAFNSGRIGVDSVVYGAGTGTPAIDEILDDFDEKLTIASAVTNTVTVRSDVFAVWFVLHGYQRSDVEGLSDTPGRADPLVPTIAKRYLMIVDRSNVTRKGDKPRILMMQELPM